jgi:hypothetical protein
MLPTRTPFIVGGPATFAHAKVQGGVKSLAKSAQNATLAGCLAGDERQL